MSSLTDQTTDYANRVVSGDIVAGKYVRLQCQRHIDDLSNDRGLTFDIEAAEKAIRFFPAVLSVTEGDAAGKPFKLLPWHLFVVGSVFGWKDRNGLRRYRLVWLETGKGQAKSPLMAAIGLLICFFSGAKRAEGYCIGEDRKTANVMFRDAVAMCRAPIPNRGNDTLESLGKVLIRGVGDNAWKIESADSMFQPIANSDAVSGPRPNYVAGDEIHEMKSSKGIEIWRAAIAKMSGDPLMILGTNTPSIDQHVGTEYAEMFERILEGKLKDDSAFAYIARVDDDDDPFQDESCWVKSLPALGITYPLENVRKTVESSKLMISNMLTTKRLYFGIKVGSAGFWIDEERWETCQGDVIEADMIGRRLHLSLDLSKKNDLTALSGCWEGKELAVKTWYWTTSHGIEERSIADKVPYRELEAEGLLEVTNGATIDYQFVAKQVKQLCASHSVEQLAVDSAYLQDFMRACEEIGFDVWVFDGEDSRGDGLKIVRHAQGKRVVFEEKMLCMPVSIRHLEDHILNETITIDRSRLTTICASNTVVDEDAQANKCFDKARSRGRIDGMVTIAMAVGSATSSMESRKTEFKSRVI